MIDKFADTAALSTGATMPPQQGGTMLRHIPDFILERHAHAQSQGSLRAYVLFLDCADFTKLSLRLLQEGKQGAEELAGLLNAMLDVPIGIVRRYGGFVSLFAGDAFCAVFPDAGDSRVLSAVSDIRRHFAQQPTYQGSLGSYDLQARQTVCYGDLAWEIFVNAWQNEFVFSGEPLREMAELSGLKSELIFSESAARHLGWDLFRQLEQGYCPSGPAPELPECPLQYDFPPETDHAFRNARYAGEEPQNEIRSGAFCFASLQAIPPAGRSAAIAVLERLADSYCGYVNKLDATDKGLTAIILFGLPRSQGKTLEQICRFSLEASAALPQLALGISCGSVYAGNTGGGGSREYTALGYPPNLASRLMSKARPGEILTDASFWQEYYRSYPFAYLGVLNLKGIAQPLRYYRLEQKSGVTLSRQESRFTGRSEELRSLRDLLEQHLKERNNALIRVCGEPGIGKSRLASEALSALDQGRSRIIRISCDALLRPPLEAVKQLVRSYFYYNPLLPAEAGTAMFRGLWAALAGQDPELLRSESCIAHLLGYGWENSVWSLL
ncbi:MAG TPA: AAA family ATPase, partial [Candidatus Syntrophosphaera sp.]|nr:AAA family ATPase [Candidatus Syntrophosphaera sp.]